MYTYLYTIYIQYTAWAISMYKFKKKQRDVYRISSKGPPVEERIVYSARFSPRSFHSVTHSIPKRPLRWLNVAWFVSRPIGLTVSCGEQKWGKMHEHKKKGCTKNVESRHQDNKKMRRPSGARTLWTSMYIREKPGPTSRSISMRTLWCRARWMWSNTYRVYATRWRRLPGVPFLLSKIPP